MSNGVWNHGPVPAHAGQLSKLYEFGTLWRTTSKHHLGTPFDRAHCAIA